MGYEILLCPNCGSGGDDLVAAGKNAFLCKRCGHKIAQERADAEEAVLAVLKREKRELLAGARKNLYEAAHAEEISSSRVLECARRVKELLPDDFLANFYEAASQADARILSAFLDGTDPRVCADFIGEVGRFSTRSLDLKQVAPLKSFFARAYDCGVLDNATFTNYVSIVEVEAEKLEAGIYRADLPRDVFVAYSSMDMAEVNALVAYLEAEGLQCFVSSRNLRHGKGAEENYEQLLQTAMRHCKCVVFVSTPHSRSLACDALGVELPYIIENLPKLPRIEYRPGSDMGAQPSYGAKVLLEDFFRGLEYCRTKEDVLRRIVRIQYGTGKASPQPEEHEETFAEIAAQGAEKIKRKVTKTAKGFLRRLFSTEEEETPSEEAPLDVQDGPVSIWRTPKTGEILKFGRYKGEEIEWIVLKVEKDRALILSRYALDFRKYHKRRCPVTWRDASLRKWLNGRFRKKIFDCAEATRILKTTVENPDNPYSKARGGDPTEDHLFLLSIQEVEKYLGSKKTRDCETTFYARKKRSKPSYQRKVTYYERRYVRFADWWSRSPGGDSDRAARVESHDSGEFSKGNRILSAYVNTYGVAVRPAVWIKI